MEVINTSLLEYANGVTFDYKRNVHKFYDQFKIGIESADRSKGALCFLQLVRKCERIPYIIWFFPLTQLNAHTGELNGPERSKE